MPRAYSAHWLESTGNTAGTAPLYLLEIEHADLTTPIRVVNDTQDLVSNGDTYTAFAFRITLPDDFEAQLPRARISIDNVGRELVQWLDASGGGQGATVRIMQVMRDDPDVIEHDITLDLVNVSQNVIEVSGELGFDDTLNLSGNPIRHSPDVSPGLF